MCGGFRCGPPTRRDSHRIGRWQATGVARVRRSRDRCGQALSVLRPRLPPRPVRRRADPRHSRTGPRQAPYSLRRLRRRCPRRLASRMPGIPDYPVRCSRPPAPVSSDHNRRATHPPPRCRRLTWPNSQRKPHRRSGWWFPSIPPRWSSWTGYSTTATSPPSSSPPTRHCSRVSLRSCG